MELNDTLLTATDTGIVDSAPGTYLFSGEIGDNVYGSNDVDIYSATLLAGDSIILDIDAQVNGSLLDSVVRVFDVDGNELAENDITPTGLDSLLKFTPTEDGQYYFGVSDYANLFYDPNVENSGSSSFNDGGEYDLKVSIASNIRGNNGSNTIAGTSQPDFIQGLGGNDVIQALAGNDTVIGGAGRDSVEGSAGDDSLFGSLGADTLLGGVGKDTLNGAENRDRLLGGQGNDVLIGQQDRDTLRGQGGNDELRGGTGNDFLFGGTGSDTLDGSEGNDRINGEGGRDLLTGDSGADTMKGGGGNDEMNGGTGADLLFGNRGDDKILGGDGADTLNGQENNDTLRGQAEDDVLNGGIGDDLLIGGSGRDTMTGGAGVDSFLYENSRHGLDTITDYDSSDRFVLTDLLSPPGNATFNSANPFDDYIHLVQVGADTKVRFDAGGDRANNQLVTLATLQNVEASWVTADNFVF